MPTKSACPSWAILLLHDLVIHLKSGEKRWRNRGQTDCTGFYSIIPTAVQLDGKRMELAGDGSTRAANHQILRAVKMLHSEFALQFAS